MPKKHKKPALRHKPASATAKPGCSTATPSPIPTADAPKSASYATPLPEATAHISQDQNSADVAPPKADGNAEPLRNVRDAPPAVVVVNAPTESTQPPIVPSKSLAKDEKAPGLWERDSSEAANRLSRAATPAPASPKPHKTDSAHLGNDQDNSPSYASVVAPNPLEPSTLHTPASPRPSAVHLTPYTNTLAKHPAETPQPPENERLAVSRRIRPPPAARAGSPTPLPPYEAPLIPNLFEGIKADKRKSSRLDSAADRAFSAEPTTKGKGPAGTRNGEAESARYDFDEMSVEAGKASKKPRRGTSAYNMCSGHLAKAGATPCNVADDGTSDEDAATDTSCASPVSSFRAHRSTSTPTPCSYPGAPNESPKAIERHVAFFARTSSEWIAPLDTFTAFRELGFGVVLSLMSVLVIHLGFSWASWGYPITPWSFDWQFRCRIDGMAKCKHGSDSGCYDTSGHFVQEKFDALWDKWSEDGKTMTKRELWKMCRGHQLIFDPFGWGAQLFEWGSTYLLIWPSDGRLKKESVKGVFEGDLFYELAKERQQSRNSKRKEKSISRM